MTEGQEKAKRLTDAGIARIKSAFGDDGKTISVCEHNNCANEISITTFNCIVKHDKITDELTVHLYCSPCARQYMFINSIQTKIRQN